jgi:hypothetical protein
MALTAEDVGTIVRHLCCTPRESAASAQLLAVKARGIGASHALGATSSIKVY